MLITGGSGALGQLICRWLLDAEGPGLRRVVLVSRSGAGLPLDRHSDHLYQEHHTSTSVLVSAVRADTACAADALAMDQHDCAPDAHIGAGGHLEDAGVRRQTPGHLRRAAAPKLGALRRPGASPGAPLRFSLLCSSAAALVGNPGQANYAAANATMDAAVRGAAARGLPWASLRWGPWAGAGMATGAGVLDQLRRRGIEAVRPAQGLALLGLALKNCAASGPAAPVSLLMGGVRDWAAALGPKHARAAAFADLIPTEARSVAGSEADDGLSHTLLSHHPSNLTAVHDQSRIQQEIARLASAELGRDVEPSQPFMEAGLDSIGLLALGGAVGSAFGLSLGAAALFDYPTPEALAAHVAGRLRVESTGVSRTTTAISLGLVSRPIDHAITSPAPTLTRAQTLSAIQGAVAGVLGAVPERAQSFQEAGLDSIGSIELHKQLQTALDMDLPSTISFDYPTVEALVDFVDGLLRGTRLAGAPSLADESALAQLDGGGGAPLPPAVAITKASFAFPGGEEDTAALFAAGVEAVRPVPYERWDVDAHYDPGYGVPHRMYTRFGLWLPGAHAFDPASFRLSAAEAQTLDPQTRLLLTHTAPLVAGGAPDRRGGVYIGCMYTGG